MSNPLQIEQAAAAAIIEGYARGDRRIAAIGDWVAEKYETAKEILVNQGTPVAQGEALAWRGINAFFAEAKRQSRAG